MVITLAIPTQNQIETMLQTFRSVYKRPASIAEMFEYTASCGHTWEESAEDWLDDAVMRSIVILMCHLFRSCSTRFRTAPGHRGIHLVLPSGHGTSVPCQRVQGGKGHPPTTKQRHQIDVLAFGMNWSKRALETGNRPRAAAAAAAAPPPPPPPPSPPPPPPPL